FLKIFLLSIIPAFILSYSSVLLFKEIDLYDFSIEQQLTNAIINSPVQVLFETVVLAPIFETCLVVMTSYP
ncbi:MAG: hypothetical protein AAGB12_11060, partial [Pseudomonadota bacterium]